MIDPGQEKRPKRLVMFDIDGTLIESMDIDGACYVQALEDVFGFRDVPTDASRYRHVTDIGILSEICLLRRGFAPTATETRLHRDRFLELLEKSISALGALRQVAGAASVLDHLLSSKQYAVAYASGSWESSALFKLRSAGLPVDGIPRAFSDDDPTREGICVSARKRAEALYGTPLDEVVFVGDGVWDIRCARNLGYGFIGIGRGGSAGALQSEGAATVLPDFLDSNEFFRALGASFSSSPSL